MSWFADSSVEALYAREHIIEAIAIDADFPSGHVRLTSWPAGLTIGGSPYTSAAGVTNIDQSDETTDLIAEPRVYTLSGVDLTVIPESEIDNAWGRSWIEYLVGIDPDYSVVGTEIAFEGYIARIRRLESNAPVLQVHVNHCLSGLDQPDGWRRTNQHQREFFSGDGGYRHVEALGQTELIWGGQRVIPGMGGGGGGGRRRREYDR